MEEQSPAVVAPSGTATNEAPASEARQPEPRAPRPPSPEPSAESSPASSDTPAQPRTPGAPAKARRARPVAPVPKKRRHPVRVAVVAVLLVVVLLFGGAAAGFAWLYWFSEDDGADLTGTWYLAGTATPITITEDRIQLTDDVAYRYTLNDRDKTFELSFGNLKGGGRYRFSLDRNQVALVDGDFSGADTLGADLSWTLRALVESAQGRVLAPEEAVKGVTLLSRTPTGTPSLPEASDAPETPTAGDASADAGSDAESDDRA